MTTQDYEFLGEGGQDDVPLNPLKFSVDEEVFTASDLAALAPAKATNAQIADLEDLATPYVVLDGGQAVRRDTLLLSGVIEGDKHH